MTVLCPLGLKDPIGHLQKMKIYLSYYTINGAPKNIKNENLSGIRRWDQK
jgi:hypothetical protein